MNKVEVGDVFISDEGIIIVIKLLSTRDHFIGSALFLYDEDMLLGDDWYVSLFSQDSVDRWCRRYMKVGQCG